MKPAIRFPRTTSYGIFGVMSVIVEIKNLSVRISDNPILTGIDLHILEGGVTAIIGPNGSGKSTLMKTILGLRKPTHGSTSIFGIPTKKLTVADREKIGYVPQSFSFDWSIPMTVTEFLQLMFFRRESKQRGTIQEVTKTLKRLGAYHLHDRLVGELSGGEMQRVLIARAMVTHPRVLFLDEPSTGIDIGGEETLYQLVSTLQREEGLTIIMVTHDLNVVYEYADRVICLNKKLIGVGKPDEVITSASISKLYGSDVTLYHHIHPKGHA